MTGSAVNMANSDEEVNERRLILQHYWGPTATVSLWPRPLDPCTNLFGVFSCDFDAQDRMALHFCQQQGGFGWHYLEWECKNDLSTGGWVTARYREWVESGQVTRTWEESFGLCRVTQLICRFEVP